MIWYTVPLSFAFLAMLFESQLWLSRFYIVMFIVTLCYVHHYLKYKGDGTDGDSSGDDVIDDIQREDYGLEVSMRIPDIEYIDIVNNDYTERG